MEASKASGFFRFYRMSTGQGRQVRQSTGRPRSTLDTAGGHQQRPRGRQRFRWQRQPAELDRQDLPLITDSGLVAAEFLNHAAIGDW